MAVADDVAGARIVFALVVLVGLVVAWKLEK